MPGLAFKLKVLGIGNMGFGAAKVLGWIYTVVVVWATVAAARRPLNGIEKPAVWLATLRSPFLPQAYAGFPPLWLLTLVAATYAPTPRVLAATIAGWMALGVFVPMDMISARPLALITFIPQVSTALVAVVALRRVVAMEAAQEPPVPAPLQAVGA